MTNPAKTQRTTALPPSMANVTDDPVWVNLADYDEFNQF
jgi:hypothetical protein